jgi:hypothetical protein
LFQTNAGSLTVSNTMTASSTGSLTLSAYADTVVNSAITLTGGALTRLCRKYSEGCKPHLSAGKIILLKP